MSIAIWYVTNSSQHISTNIPRKLVSSWTTSKMEATGSSETMEPIQQYTRRQITENQNAHIDNTTAKEL